MLTLHLVCLHAKSPGVEKCLFSLGGRNTVACDVPHVGVIPLEVQPGTSGHSIYHGIAAAKSSPPPPDRSFYRIGTLVMAALYTGARVGELLALRWDDVDFAAGSLTIRRTLVDPGKQQDGREPLFKESTKDDEVRVVPIAPELEAALKQWRHRWERERKAVGGGYFDRFNLVFVTETGWPMSPRNVNRDLAALLKAAGVRRLSVHKLRHTFATRMLDAGADIDTVAELLGDELQTVKKYYVGDRPEAKKAAVERLGRYFHPDGGH